ncbi:hypothetical protein LMG28614_06989 [Paraburkholderia ultramafica]|uniref:Uncharacterized protein n=1 Tax=Paraburkholderia ultramafica TaxID=1544867 RepID=A0A6S7CGN5_9BURK|nr:hypothetical protein LMG28614_06989 [Paraburkholderia ultramafica]
MDRSDYAHDDTGNLVLLEHVNLTIPDQRLATAFYVSGLPGRSSRFGRHWPGVQAGNTLPVPRW